METADLPLLLTRTEVARLFGVTNQTVWRWTQAGRLAPALGFGRPRYRRDVVLALLTGGPQRR